MKEWIFLAYWPGVETPNVVRADAESVQAAEVKLRAELPGMDVFLNIGYVAPDTTPAVQRARAEEQGDWADARLLNHGE